MRRPQPGFFVLLPFPHVHLVYTKDTQQVQRRNMPPSNPHFKTLSLPLKSSLHHRHTHNHPTPPIDPLTRFLYSPLCGFTLGMLLLAIILLLAQLYRYVSRMSGVREPEVSISVPSVESETRTEFTRNRNGSHFLEVPHARALSQMDGASIFGAFDIGPSLLHSNPSSPIRGVPPTPHGSDERNRTRRDSLRTSYGTLSDARADSDYHETWNRSEISSKSDEGSPRDRTPSAVWQRSVRCMFKSPVWRRRPWTQSGDCKKDTKTVEAASSGHVEVDRACPNDDNGKAEGREAGKSTMSRRQGSAKAGWTEQASRCSTNPGTQQESWTSSPGPSSCPQSPKSSLRQTDRLPRIVISPPSHSWHETWPESNTDSEHNYHIQAGSSHYDGFSGDVSQNREDRPRAHWAWVDEPTTTEVTHSQHPLVFEPIKPGVRYLRRKQSV